MNQLKALFRHSSLVCKCVSTGLFDTHPSRPHFACKLALNPYYLMATSWLRLEKLLCILSMSNQMKLHCTPFASLPPIRVLEKCRVIGHNPQLSSFCSLNPNVLPNGIQQECSAKIFSACDWWKAVNCGTSYKDPSESVVCVIPLGLLGSAS